MRFAPNDVIVSASPADNESIAIIKKEADKYAYAKDKMKIIKKDNCIMLVAKDWIDL
jgi:hypothetical protein